MIKFNSTKINNITRQLGVFPRIESESSAIKKATKTTQGKNVTKSNWHPAV